MSVKKNKAKKNNSNDVMASPLKKGSYRMLLEFLLILMLVFVTYGNSIKNDYNIDDGYIVSIDEGNTLTKEGILGIPKLLISTYSTGPGVTYGYRPFGKITMAIEYSLWGNNPHYSHFVNLLLFAINVFLLLLFFRKVASWLNYNNQTVIYLSVFLFIIHPIHTEVVCSIKNREEILSYIFSLSAIFMYFKIAEKSEWKYYLYFLLFSVLAFLSKQTAINIYTIVFLLIFFREWVLKNPAAQVLPDVNHPSENSVYDFILANRWRFLALLILLAIVAVTFKFFQVGLFVVLFLISNVVLRDNHSRPALFLKSIFTIKNTSLLVVVFFVFNLVVNYIPTLLPKEDVGWQLDSMPYLFTPSSHSIPNGIQTILFYLKKMLIPFPLLYYYGYNMLPDQSWSSVYPYLGIIGAAGLAYFVLYNINKKQQLFLIFWILFLAATMLPFSNLAKRIYVTGIVGERLVYQASTAFCVLMVLGIDFLSAFLKNKFNDVKISSRQLSMAIISIIAIPYFVLTVQRNKQWMSKKTLYEHDIKYLSKSARANFIYAGNIMSRAVKEKDPATYEQELQKANMYFHRSLDIYPDFNRALLELGNLYIGYLLQKDSALYFYNKVDSVPNKYTYVRARELMGSIHYNDSDLTKAMLYYDEAFKLYPKNLPLYKDMINILLMTKQYDRVLTLSDTAINNKWPEGYANKGDAYLNKSDTDMAAKYWERALENGFRNDVLMKNLDYYYKLKGQPK